MRNGFKMAGLVALVTAALPGVGTAQMPAEVALETTVRDDDRGVRAVIRYRPEVFTGGMDEVVNADGSVSVVHWDGFLGQFEAELIEGALAGAEAAAFLREAVKVVCPSAEAAALAQADVVVSGSVLRVFAQCPEVDAR